MSLLVLDTKDTSSRSFLSITDSQSWLHIKIIREELLNRNDDWAPVPVACVRVWALPF